MIRALLTIGLAVTAQATFAGTNIIFANNGSKATITMLAFVTNPDAISYNERLTVPEEEINGKRTKKFKFIDADGIEALAVVCAFAKFGSTGSCVTTFKKSANLVMNKDEGKMTYELTGESALELASHFVAPTDPESREIYRSSDDHFVITFVTDEHGALQSIKLTYE